MHYTFREKTLQQAMRKASEVLGPDATVIGTSEVRVPHSTEPIGYEVIAVGVSKEGFVPPSNLTGITPNTPVEIEEEHLEATTEPLIPENWDAQDCVDEIMVQLFDVVNELQGLKKVRTRWVETRSLLEEAQGEIRDLTVRWEQSLVSRRTAPERENSIVNPLWGRHERTVAALIGPRGVGKTTAALRIAERAQSEGVPTGIIQWTQGQEQQLHVQELTLTQTQIPLRQAGNRQEVMRAIFELSECELVLIDTEAHSAWQPEEIERILSSLEGPGIELHLVLPSTWELGELQDAEDAYEGRLDHLLISHLDSPRYWRQLDLIQNALETPIAHGMNQRELLSIKEFKGVEHTMARQEMLQVGNICPSEEIEFHETI